MGVQAVPYDRLKRAIDVVLIVIGMVILAPVFPCWRGRSGASSACPCCSASSVPACTAKSSRSVSSAPCCVHEAGSSLRVEAPPG